MLIHSIRIVLFIERLNITFSSYYSSLFDNNFCHMWNQLVDTNDSCEYTSRKASPIGSQVGESQHEVIRLLLYLHRLENAVIGK